MKHGEGSFTVKVMTLAPTAIRSARRAMSSISAAEKQVEFANTRSASKWSCSSSRKDPSKNAIYGGSVSAGFMRLS